MTRVIDGANGPRYVRVHQRAELPSALSALGLRSGRPVLVSVGGASGMVPEHLDAMAVLMREVIPLLERWGVAVVDGGTDVGVMRVMGQARNAARAGFPLIGVAAAGTVVVPDAAGTITDAAELDPYHTHVVLVPGDAWGDESPWLSEVATVLAGAHRSATLVINGGEITYQDVSYSVAAGRPVVVVAGAGRTADAIAAAASGEDAGVRAARLAASPLVCIVHLDDPDGVASALAEVLVS